MANRSERHVRKVKGALSTPAARPARERALAKNVVAKGPDGGTNRGSSLDALTGAARSAPNMFGGSSQPDASGQVGTPGNLNVFGFLTGEDYNQDLDGFPMFANYNKMRLGDAQVNATLLMLKLPLKGASWVARPASDDPQDVAIADFVQANLIDDDSLARSWQHVLDNAMLKFDFGCAAAEVVWGTSAGADGEARLMRAHPRVMALAQQRGRSAWDLSSADGKRSFFQDLDRTLEDIQSTTGPVYAKVDDLAPRLPRTFYRWVEDPKTGTLAYLQQFAPKNGQYGFWNIDAANLALHVRAREGNNYYGRSVLRTAYAHWWWKQQLYRIDMIGHDRFHVGIPRAALTKDYNSNSAPLLKIEETLKGLRSHDRSYMIQPYGVEYDIYGSRESGSWSSGILLSIDHHNQMIARNILQSFAAQGEQKHGSFGAAKVTSEVYFDALEGEANEIGSELKHAVVKRLCDLNFNMKGRKYPSLICTGISAVDFSQLASSLSELADKGVITPEDDLEAWVRDLADAPGLPDALKNRPRGKAAVSTSVTPPAALADDPAVDDPTITAEEEIAAAKRTPHQEGGRSFSRVPTALERRIFDLHGVPRELDAAQGRLVHELGVIRTEQLRVMAARIAQKDSRDTAAFTDIRHAHVKIPKVAAITAAIRDAQRSALEYGRQTVRDELERQGVSLPKTLAADAATSAANASTARSALVSSAKITARKTSENWLARALDEGLRIRRTGVKGKALEDRIIANLAAEAESGIKRDAAAEINEGFGLGRALEARELQKFVNETATYSAILDAATCTPCADLDGQEFVIDSDAYNENMPPNVNCAGRDACRCVYLYLSIGDVSGAAGTAAIE